MLSLDARRVKSSGVVIIERLEVDNFPGFVFRPSIITIIMGVSGIW